LLEKTHKGKIDVIYIDPPYNTGKEFVYNDDLIVTSDSYMHSKWLSFMYSRLKIARELLDAKGVIFLSIDDNEFSQLKMLCDEIFDENNNIANFCVIRAEGGGMAKQVIKGHDYCLVYAKDIFSFSPLAKEKDIRGEIVEKDKIKYWIQEDWLRKEFGKYGNCHYEEVLQYKGEKVKKEIDDGLQNGEYVLIPKSNGMNIVGKLRRFDQDSSKFYSILKHLNKNGINELKELKVEFDYPKPSSLIKELVSGATFFLDRKEATVLDFFAGFRVMIMTQSNSQVNTRV
ncbi:DNA methyltransferase, partial [Gemella morbillorum]|uniref:DNA methyltransferase n=1 Tax=Gemella morbillorum TaxID=29391 RepID=UPI00248D7BDF